MIDTERVWATTRASLLGFLRKRVKDEHDAEDLLQETFVRVHDGLSGLEDEQRVGAWVFRVARNVLADHFRRRQPTERADLEAHPEETEVDGNLNREVEGWLVSMTRLLSPEDREAVELAEIAGIPQREIARRLGLSLSGAKSRIQRSRRRLRDLVLQCCHLDFDRRGNVVHYERRGSCCGEDRSSVAP